MATLTIRNVPETERQALRVRAAQNGRSMEAELRLILATALAREPEEEVDLYTAIRRIVEPLGGIELDIPPDAPFEPPKFE